MAEEMDQEKEDGLGLPVGVTNDVAQAQMMSQVPDQPTHPNDLEHEQQMLKVQQKEQGKQQTKESTLVTLKRIL